MSHRIKSTQSQSITVLSVMLLILALAVNVLFLRFNAFRGFNLFDMGAFLDASWRVYKGQVPYIDFIYTSGPIHLYMNALFFFLFGFGKMAILAHLITVSSIVMVITYLIVSKYTNMLFTFLITLLSGACFYWPMSHPWYDQSAHLWGILAIALILDELPIQGTVKICRIILSALLVMIAFLTKSNIGLAYALIFMILLGVSKDFNGLISFVVISVLSVLIFLAFTTSVQSYFKQAFLNYGFAQNSYFQVRRVTSILAPINWLCGFYWLIAVALLWSCAPFIKRLTQDFILFFGVLFVALFSMLTGSILHESNIPLLGISCALAVRLNYKVKVLFDRDKKFSLMKHERTNLALFVLTVAFLMESTAYGFELKPWTYVGNPFGSYALKTKPFEGWMFNMEQGEDLDALVKFIKKNVSNKESLLVLTDLQILYPLTERDSYRGIPFIFSEGDVPARGLQLEMVRSNIINHPPDWIVTHRFQTSYVTFLVQYLKLRDFIVDNYEPIKKWNNYAILKKKK